MKQWRCKVCGYNAAEEEISFEELPDGWVCPICGAGKDQFEAKEW